MQLRFMQMILINTQKTGPQKKAGLSKMFLFLLKRPKAFTC
jgi:hypothetical protein